MELKLLSTVMAISQARVGVNRYRFFAEKMKYQLPSMVIEFCFDRHLKTLEQ